MRTFFKISTAACALTVIVASVAPAEAANRYVRAGATGANTGADWTNAYSALPATLVRGDVYYIADGSYSGYIFDDAASGTTVITIKKATVSDHGTDTGWLATYGDGQVAFTSGLEFRTSNWVFDGVTGGGPGAWNVGFGFKITEVGDATPIIEIGKSSAANNITIRHVEFQGKGSVATAGGGDSNDAIAAWNGDGLTLSYAWMHGIGRCPFFMASRNFIGEYLYVESYFASGAVHAEVASIWDIGQSVGNTTFRWSLFEHSAGTGGIMWDNKSNPSAQLYFYGNIVYRPSTETWEIQNGFLGGWTGNSAEECHNFHVYNNTFINVNPGYSTLVSLMNVISGNDAFNNLWYNTDSPQFSKFPSHDYNHFINAGGSHSEAHGSSATTGDPFQNYAARDFRLKAATAAGTALASPFNIDMFGNVRGADGTWDRGAVEFTGAAITPPAAPSNVRVVK